MSYRKLANEIGQLVEEKQAAYGDSFSKCGEFLKLLYPKGIEPAQYVDALCVVRIFDKLMRVATDKDALGESPYRDIAGYGLLGAMANVAVLDELQDKGTPGALRCINCGIRSYDVTFKVIDGNEYLLCSDCMPKPNDDTGADAGPAEKESRTCRECSFHGRSVRRVRIPGKDLTGLRCVDCVPVGYEVNESE